MVKSPKWYLKFEIGSGSNNN
ncbi:Protein of unknown function [Lactobacillus helveticus CIRM-BIA 101]|uniref:Uncharacterized protein n=2 Tax=Lactobacillus helveticus TaxID=1587 RepID=U6FAI8_LACHE|nr:Protein of unknown function [Lactobacillus helveticus CIRM-BIA 951]CDI60050.1 Protein of unknown function [Lactobacillus helveticus CIRM-BIA 104]CDI63186.1 Protein of unknown function [Lactobacillus helveticus CIRM-BIA 103]CDI65739.1 Protein of unknown function [Lactobacillus helveticus CIRM-BIA 101]